MTITPEQMESLAKAEKSREIMNYGAAIVVLRDEKGFSYREIAEWMGQHGIEIDYNQAFRMYTKAKITTA